MFSIWNQVFVQLSFMFSLGVLLVYPLRLQKKGRAVSTIKTQLLVGIIAGSIGALCASNPLMLEHVPLDARLTVLVVALFYGGWGSGVVTSAILLLVVWMMAPFGARADAWGLLSISVLLFLTERCLHQNSRSLKTLGILLGSGMIYSLPVLYLLTGSDGRFIKTLMFSLFLNSLTSLFLYYFLHHVQRHFQELDEERKLAVTDDLTQLNNRRKLRKVLCQFEQSGTPFTVLLFDIDSFKQINDTYGHEVGDSIIRQMATLLTEYCPKSGILGRYGGEEFLLLLPDFDVSNTVHLAETIRIASATTLFQINPIKTVQVTLSIGVSWLEEACSRMNAVHQADVALYEAKRRGKNQVVLYTEVDPA